MSGAEAAAEWPEIDLGAECPMPRRSVAARPHDDRAAAHAGRHRSCRKSVRCVPTGLLNRPRLPSSQGFDPPIDRTNFLPDQINPQPSQGNLPPQVIRAFWAHCMIRIGRVSLSLCPANRSATPMTVASAAAGRGFKLGTVTPCSLQSIVTIFRRPECSVCVAPLLADTFLLPYFQIKMKMISVIIIGVWTEHGRKNLTSSIMNAVQENALGLSLSEEFASMADGLVTS